MKVKYEMVLDALFNAGMEEISSAASDAREAELMALEADWQEAFKSGDLDWVDFTWILYGEIARNEA